MLKHTLITALGAAVLLAAPPPANADRFELSIGTTARHLHSTTADVISPNDRHSFFSMTAGVAVDRRLLDTRLQFELGLEAGEIEGEMFDRMRTDTHIETLTAGARLRWDLGWGLFGSGRAALGVSRVHFELRDSYGSGYIKDRGFAGVFELGGGLDYALVRSTKPSGVTVALRADLGYTAATPVNIEANPGRDMNEGTISIPTTPADLGALNTSSWNFRLALVTRF